MVRHPAVPGLSGTVGTAVDRAARFHTMADDFAATVLAARRERVHRTLEAIEGVRIAPRHGHFKRLIVLVAADFTSGHFYHSLPRCRLRYMFVSSLTPRHRRDNRHKGLADWKPLLPMVFYRPVRFN